MIVHLLSSCSAYRWRAEAAAIETRDTGTTRGPRHPQLSAAAKVQSKPSFGQTTASLSSCTAVHKDRNPTPNARHVCEVNLTRRPAAEAYTSAGIAQNSARPWPESPEPTDDCNVPHKLRIRRRRRRRGTEGPHIAIGPTHCHWTRMLQVQTLAPHSQPRTDSIEAEERCATNESDDTRQVRETWVGRGTQIERTAASIARKDQRLGMLRRGLTQHDKSMTRG